MSRYVKDEYIRGWGFPGTYGEELKEEHKYPVAGNCVFVAAIVIGKPAAGQDLATWSTNTPARPTGPSGTAGNNPPPRRRDFSQFAATFLKAPLLNPVTAPFLSKAGL